MSLDVDSIQTSSPRLSSSGGFSVSPEDGIGFPRALPRKKAVNSKRKMLIAADTSEKQRLMERKSKIKAKTVILKNVKKQLFPAKESSNC